MILDTTFLHDLMHGDGDAIDTAIELDQTNEPIHLSAISVYELWYGIEYLEKAAEERERERVTSVLTRYPIIEPDEAIFQTAARIDATLDREGNPIDDLADSIIGATAVTTGDAVLTRNVDHFQRMPDVDVRTY